MRTATGKVYLIGAGPGAIELLTLKAVRCLRLADVILLDDLVSREVLDFVREESRVIEVGKRGGCQATPQEFIERLMIAEAKAGRAVARVKGGDPFVFGRGGEEMQALRAAGVAVEVVPGITSGISAPAAAGIPVTHRDHARGVTFVTGHTRNGEEPNWQALAQSGTTLVIYMGLARLQQITAALIESGLAPQTPAAVIQNATLPNEKRVVARLSVLHDWAARAGIESPAIVVIGEVVKLASLRGAMRDEATSYLTATRDRHPRIKSGVAMTETARSQP
ncbi:MAG: uroporphyrinogen-III C-methyltransferase [Burkholderiales bacterium]